MAKILQSAAKGIILSQFIYYCDENEDNKIDKPFTYWKNKLGINRNEWREAIRYFCQLNLISEKRDEMGSLFYLLNKGKVIELMNSDGLQVELSATNRKLPTVQVLSSSQSRYKQNFDKFA